MVYLRPRVVTWAYSRGNQNLLSNLEKTVTESKLKTNVLKQNSSNNSNIQADRRGDLAMDKNIDYFADVDEEQLENIIDFLIENLKDKDTIVRWSAAKGLGRITSRLDLDMADDVVNSIIELFSPNDSEATWHGNKKYKKKYLKNI